MSDQGERRQDYIQLKDEISQTNIQLGKVIERLDNTISALNKHVDIDNDRESRIRWLEGFIYRLDGKIVAYSAVIGVVIYWGGSTLKAKGVL